MRAHLDELIDNADFTRRHTSATDDDRRHMLAVIGEASIDALLDHTVPPSIRMAGVLDLDGPRRPESVLAELRQLADRNVARTSLIGMGYYGTITPPVIVRNVLENPAWYTAYTPYQPEISQGRLEALLTFQTMVTELTGFELANASLLDEATAAAEAMMMARRLSSATSNRFVVHRDTHPQTIAVLVTRAEPVDIDLVVGDVADLAGGCFGALFSLPTSSGALPDWTAAINSVHAVGGLAVVATDLMACVLTTPPAQLGADIAIGSAQRFGVSMGFGGPHAAFIACAESAARALPGRLVGVSTDTAGRPAMRLALQTREQHIRREKATSNICTAQVLLANIAGLYAAWHGPDGLRTIAERIHRLTSIAVEALRAAGFELVNDTWFDTVQVRCEARTVLARAGAAGLDLRLVDDRTIGFSLDETTTREIVAALLGGFEIDAAVDDTELDGLPRRRNDEVLTETVFARYHSEHEMLRYLRRLADKDLALDRTMIPLGSCTMKLNATTEMEPLTWPGLADMHPFTPDEHTIGIRQMIAELESMLLAITGYDAVSLQPNAGSQGELSGLLAIRAYHHSRDEGARNVCLIPSSAHGTNAASAVLAGLKVVVVACDDRGNIDLDDLEAKASAAGAALAAAMVTYPSTHGVFEPSIGAVCEIVHRHGGQVYVDGANLNAMVGLAQPGKFGADVSHLNLHKTFCIPHGGGGPGVGPVAVRAHLAPFLPAHPLSSAGSPVGAVAAAPYGSAAILAISWVYIKLMGAAGLTQASAMAVLNANYLASRLDPHFPVLYTGEHGRVGHECILDLRPITKATGVTVDDVAKRLIDYGFHAPTVSFPVSGTLMVEPTESESLYELDRFCEAMIAIKGEIDAVAAGTWSLAASPLRNAPHTAEDLTGEWDRPYARQLGAYPLPALRAAKYFPPVSRIDAAYGDRHLVCTCEPLEVLAAMSA